MKGNGWGCDAYLALGLGLIALYFVFSNYCVMGNPISWCFLVFFLVFPGVFDR